MDNFDWEDFKNGKIAVHCDTEDKAKDFVKECYEHGIKWVTSAVNKENKTLHTNWKIYKEDTFYFVFKSNLNNKRLFCGSIKDVDDEDIFEWKILAPELKDGMVVENRDGNFYLIRTNFNGNKILSGNVAWNLLSNFDEDLKNKVDSSLDIVKVYLPNGGCGNVLNVVFNKDYLTCIWERKEEDEVVEMTLSQVCKELGKNIKIIKED